MFDAPKSIDVLVKSKICPKKKLPYGKAENDTFYDPNCIEGVLECRDICGTKCKNECKNRTHPQYCSRGKLPQNFLYCPTQTDSTDVLEYLTYSLVIDKNIKEGKKVYKNMDQIKQILLWMISKKNLKTILRLIQSTN